MHIEEDAYEVSIFMFFVDHSINQPNALAHTQYLQPFEQQLAASPACRKGHSLELLVFPGAADLGGEPLGQFV